MRKFMLGDKVVVVREKTRGHFPILNGQVYTVKSEYEYFGTVYVILMGDNTEPTGYYKNRFDIYNEAAFIVEDVL